MQTIRWEKDKDHCCRYYQAFISKDLFGTWVLVKQWGRVDGAQGRQITVPYASQAHAKLALSEVERRRIARGYIPVKRIERVN